MTNYANQINIMRQQYDVTKPSRKLRIYQGFDNGFHVPTPFLNCIREQVSDVVPFLSGNKTYTAQTLCHPEFWKRLNDGERRMADLCIDGDISEWLRISRVNDDEDFPAQFRLIHQM